MSLRPRIVFLLAFFLLMMLHEPGAARDPSGTAVAVVEATEVTGEIGQRPLQTLDVVYMGDRIATERTGEAQIIFRDQTKLVVGPTSVVVIDSFVFNDDDSARSVGMSATKGVFRFITGVSQKQAYTLKTPAATIGVRGTGFDFYVAPNGETGVAMFEGEAQVCDLSGECVDLGACSVVVVGPNGGITEVESPEEKSQVLLSSFPYALSQVSLQPDFKLDVSACLIRASFDVEPALPQSASPH